MACVVIIQWMGFHITCYYGLSHLLNFCIFLRSSELSFQTINSRVHCEHIVTWKKGSLNYSEAGPRALLFSTTRACKLTILRTEQGPTRTQVQLLFVIKHISQCMVYAIYLYCSFNYPVLPAFEVRSISSYLMPGEACTCAPGAWILLFHFHVPGYNPVVIVLFSIVTKRSTDSKNILSPFL